MKIRSLFVASVALCAAAFCQGNELVAHAMPPAAHAEQPVHPINPAQMHEVTAVADTVAACANVPPNITWKLTNSGIENFSQGAIGNGDCHAFITDYTMDKDSAKVPAGSGLNPGYLFDGRDTVREIAPGSGGQSFQQEYFARVTEPQCMSWRHTLHLYLKKQGETTFTHLAGGTLTPKWNAQGVGFGPVCVLNPGANFKPMPILVPPATGVDTVRVTIEVAGAPGQLASLAGHPHL
jgi:hypothetical protein